MLINGSIFVTIKRHRNSDDDIDMEWRIAMKKLAIGLFLSVFVVSACSETSNSNDLVCDDESCETNENTNCANDTWKCIGVTLLKCIENKWEIAKTCNDNTSCNESTGTCKPNDDNSNSNGNFDNCTNGSWMCYDDSMLMKCANNKWQLVETCKDDTICNPRKGMCEPNNKDNNDCTNGSWKCNENTLLKCTQNKWETVKVCDGGTSCNEIVGECTRNGLTDPECRPTEHIYAGECEPDDLNHCGTHTVDCTNLSGWSSGKCVDKKCVAESCTTGYHVDTITDNDGDVQTTCVIDTPEACGSASTKCNPGQICSQGQCKSSCQDGETLCEGSCINPMTNSEFCGAMYSCSYYKSCKKNEKCVDGKCELASCQNTDEDLCTVSGMKVCINTSDNNPNHCGACNQSCPEPPKGKYMHQQCSNRKCTFVCDVFTKNCGTDTDPVCIPNQLLKTDPLNCGNCGIKCGEKEKCSDGRCVTDHTIKTCEPNQCLYNDRCVNQATHCGAKCDDCNTANHATSGYCAAGKCIATKCALGYHKYEGMCTEDTLENCGESNEVCDVVNAINKCEQGKCTFTCNTGARKINDGCYTEMKSKWRVTNDNLSIKFPTYGSRKTILINWGDGSEDEISTRQYFVEHKYSKAGTYTVSMWGDIRQWSCSYDYCNNCDGMCSNLVAILSYGDVTFTSYTFENAKMLESVPKHVPKFYLNDANHAFQGAIKFNSDITSWDTKDIVDMSGMFYNAKSFNQPLDKWDLSGLPSPAPDYLEDIFFGSGLSKENYCKLLTGTYYKYWKYAESGVNYKCP